MNYGTIQSRVADYLDRDDLTTRIQGWINDVRKDLATIGNFDYLYTEATCLTSAGTATYALPSDYVDHLDIFLNDKRLNPIGAHELDILSTYDENVDDIYLNLPVISLSLSGGSDYYAQRGMAVELYPVPSDTFTLRMKYYAQPTDFSLDADSDYISATHFMAIIFGAAYLGALYLDDEQKKSNYGTEYNKFLTVLQKKNKDKQTRELTPRIKTFKDFEPEAFRRMFRVT